MSLVKILFITSFSLMAISVVLRVVGFFRGEDQPTSQGLAKFSGFKVFNVIHTIEYPKAHGFSCTSVGLIFSTIAAYLVIISIFAFAIKVARSEF